MLPFWYLFGSAIVGKMSALQTALFRVDGLESCQRVAAECLVNHGGVSSCPTLPPRSLSLGSNVKETIFSAELRIGGTEQTVLGVYCLMYPGRK